MSTPTEQPSPEAVAAATDFIVNRVPNVSRQIDQLAAIIQTAIDKSRAEQIIEIARDRAATGFVSKLERICLERLDEAESRSRLDWFPAHKAGLSLSHNEHRNYYESVEQWLEGRPEMYEWQAPSARLRAIETDEVWTLQWYPDTPVGFLAIAAPTLQELFVLLRSL